MTGKTHLLVGTCTGVVAAATMSNNNALIFGCTIIATSIGSIMPDIDNTKSMIGSKITLISNIINKIFGHRGITHSPLVLALLSLIIFFMLRNYGLDLYKPILYGYIAGYASHLFLDALTKGGIPLLYPFARKRFSILEIKSGGLSEGIIVIILLCIIITIAFIAICKIKCFDFNFLNLGSF